MSNYRQEFIKAYPGKKRLGKKGLWYKCAHCGKWCGRAGSDNVRIKPDELMEVDHIRPWSQGGSDSVYNLQALCRPCNRAKSADPTFGDKVKMLKNNIVHADGIKSAGRKMVRQNKVLKGLGITSRR